MVRAMIGGSDEAAEDVAPPGFSFQPPPRPGEWRHHVPEPEQTFAAYRAAGAPRRTPARGVFYLQPLGDAAARHPVLLARMRDCAEAFFGVPARVRPALPAFEETWVAPRRQHHAPRILDRLAERRPSDALVQLGVATGDLFAQGLAFVFGEGSPGLRCGVVSLHRLGTPDPARFLRRALKLLCHEAGHVLGLAHCARYRCVMQGADGRRELDGQPLHLCPDDLRKLAWSTGADPTARYRALQGFYRQAGLQAEADWTQERLREDPPPGFRGASTPAR